MITPRLVQLIEKHSDDLAQGVMRRLGGDERLAADIKKVPPEELRQRAYEIYRNLSDWLTERTEKDIDTLYSAIGARRAGQGVALSSLILAILGVKEHLWEFIRNEIAPDRPVEIFSELELLDEVDLFFDRAVYYAARGYEQAKAAQAA
jgi:hypothetical protein